MLLFVTAVWSGRLYTARVISNFSFRYVSSPSKCIKKSGADAFHDN
jgi:hypothetical protein